ncbi:hypothetical protein HZS_7643 [Henneguya salminicola]|nr:hypothetical protein HZS_7643 [Henneguya salminicola]
MFHSYFNERKNKKWTNKFAIYFIMLLTPNDLVLYRTFYSGQDKINNQLKFRMYLISFLSHSNKNINENTTNEKIVGAEYPTHFPRVYELKKYRRCKLCSSQKIRKSTI